MRVTELNSDRATSSPMWNVVVNLGARPTRRVSIPGATRSPVSHRSVVPEPILTTFVTLEPGQPPVSVASNVAPIIILNRPDEIHFHVTTPLPLLGRYVLDQCDWRSARLNLCRSDNDEYSDRRIEMKLLVTKSRYPARDRVPVSRCRVGTISNDTRGRRR